MTLLLLECMQMMTIESYLSTLNRQEASYASRFAHWIMDVPVQKAIEEVEASRVGIRQSKAGAIRKQVAAILGKSL